MDIIDIEEEKSTSNWWKKSSGYNNYCMIQEACYNIFSEYQREVIYIG